MRFSVYSEMKYWGGKSPEREYAEVAEQIVHADRLGYSAYAIIEHLFFPKFSISPDPLSFFAQMAPRTKQIKFRTMLHVLPYHNPTVLASRIAEAEILLDGRYEFGVGRGHGWIPPKAGVPLSEVKDLYEESFELFFKALENERFSHHGRFYKVDDSHIVPPAPERKLRIFVGGTSDYTYELAGRKGFSVAVPPLLPYQALERQLDIYRESCAAHGNEPDIVWIHACYMDEDREVAKTSSRSLTPAIGRNSVAWRLPSVMVPVLSSNNVSTSPAASTERPDTANTLKRTRRSMPAMPMAESSAPIVVGIRVTNSATRITTEIVLPA